MAASRVSRPAGFTFIEILIVIAIIGVLAAIVTVAFNQTRIKASDARVKTNVHQLRLLGEIYYHNNNYSFRGYDDCLAEPASSCPGSLGEAVTVLTEDLTNLGSNQLYASATQDNDFCVGAALASNSDKVFCKDSAGRAGLTTASLAAPCRDDTCIPD